MHRVKEILWKKNHPTTFSQETITTTTKYAQAMEKTLHARIQQLEATLAFNRQASIAIGSSSRHEDGTLANVQSPDEAYQPPSKTEQVSLEI